MSIALGILMLFSTILYLATLILSGKLLHSNTHRSLGPFAARTLVLCSNTLFLLIFGSAAALFSTKQSVLYLIPILVLISTIPLTIPSQSKFTSMTTMQLILISMLTTILGIPVIAIYILVHFLRMKPELL